MVDSWKNIEATDIKKFMMIVDLLHNAGIEIEFNTDKRDPLYVYKVQKSEDNPTQDSSKSS